MADSNRDRKVEICARHRAGESIADLAERFQLETTRIERWLRDDDDGGGPEPLQFPVTDPALQRALSPRGLLRNRNKLAVAGVVRLGRSPADIAATLRMSLNTVANVLRAANVRSCPRCARYAVFSACRRSKSGYQSECRECMAARSRAAHHYRPRPGLPRK